MTATGLERSRSALLLDGAPGERSFPDPTSTVGEAGLPLSPIEVDALSLLPCVAAPRCRESLEPSPCRTSKSGSPP